MNNKLKFGIAGFLIGGVLVWIVITTLFNQSNFGMMQMMGFRSESILSKQEPKEFDAFFIEQMIPHHEDAITMAKLAETKAKTEEVKKLSKNIIESQSKEIDQMKVWYKEWFNREVPIGAQSKQHHGISNTSMHMGLTGTQNDIKQLEESSDFDRAFVEQMIPHHQMAVMMAEMLKIGTQRPEMKNLAEDIISGQTKEIELMRKWLTEWQ